MLKTNLKIAYRNIVRHKGNTLINITGLAIGIACCLLIALYVEDELSFDRYHKKLNNIYRVLHAYRHSENGATLPPPAPADFQVWGNSPVGPALEAEFPEVLKVCQFMGRSSLLLQRGTTRFQENNLFFMDSTAFEVFSWNLLRGNPKRALVEPYSIVLTETMAKRYFGNEDPMGQTIQIDNSDNFTVTGVMEDVPNNSHFTFDGLLSMSTYHIYREEIFGWWGYVDFYTYFLVPDNFDKSALEAKVPDFLKRRNTDGGAYTIAFEPMKNAYLRTQATRQPGTTGSLVNLYIFSLIAIFILAIACINFMNLATARAMDRAKEVGVRKVAGASKGLLVSQFLSESILLSVVAAVLALALAAALLPAFQLLSGKEITLEQLNSPRMLSALLAGSVVAGILAGIYPALVLSAFKPASVIKGLGRSSGHGFLLRKGLVIFQFGMSIALIAGTMVIFTQIKYLRDRDLGFTHEQMLVIDFAWDLQTQRHVDEIKTALAQVPQVISVSAQRTVPGGFYPKAYTTIESPEGEMRPIDPDLYEVDFDFISNFDIKVVAGRAYSREFGTDTTSAMVINESAALKAGYANPNDVIGKKFSQWGRNGVVVGVVKDFNYRSLHNKVEPLTLRLQPKWSTSSFALKVRTEDLQSTIAQVEKLWKQSVPHRPFLYSFLDDTFNQQYREDTRFGQLFTAFSLLAILIACFGLFGLSTYNAEKRTKEIGIRKVLGASVSSIVGLLSWDFLKLVLIAIVIATPLAWYAMKQWMDNFAYKATLGVEVFIIAGLTVVAIAFAVTSWQSIRIGIANPTKSLRNE